MIADIQPTAAVLTLDGSTWRPAEPEDAGDLQALSTMNGHRTIFSIPSFDESPRQIGGPNFRMPMVCVRDRRVVGGAGISDRSNRSLHAKLTCFFAEPSGAVIPVAAYVRHLFWSLPLHRVFAQIVLSEGGAEYVGLLKSAGFHDEGLVRGHALVGGQPADVAILGVLRQEFEAWSLEHEPRLTL